MKNKSKITIIGSGLAGGFLATLLVNRGYKVELYEKLSREEICDTNTKRSYNITFLGYGIDLLKKANLWDALKPYLFPLKGVSTQLSKHSKAIFTPTYDKENQYFAISRVSLLTVMLGQLEKNPLVNIHYETSLLSVDRHEKTILVQNNKTKKIQSVSCDVLIGADGANSSVRMFLQQGQDTKHTQEYSTGGYKQFTLSKAQIEELQLKTEVAYTWSAEGKFILAFPNFDGSLACLLIYPKEKKSLTTLTSVDSIKQLLQNDFPFLLPFYTNLAEQLMGNPIGGFVTIHTDPWYYKDFITLVGDAAHGFYPFFGQGTSAAFGDCMQLATLVDKHGTDWEKIFPLYQEARKRHMDALGELSKASLVRYARSKRADYNAIYDKLEFLGNSLFPKYIHPPTLIPVMNDPEHTDDFVENSRKQKILAKRIGLPFVIAILVGVIAIYERYQIAQSSKRLK